MEPHNLLIDIKSKLIIKKIFRNIKERRYLDIIKYNKKIQKKIDKGIDYYRDFYDLIELEIFPAPDNSGKFIKIKKEDFSHFHFYFNNDKSEIKKDYINKDDNVSKIKIIIDNHIKNFSYLFHQVNCIEKINFIKFFRKDIIDMSHMFSCCTLLNELNLSNFNTKNVANMM